MMKGRKEKARATALESAIAALALGVWSTAPTARAASEGAELALQTPQPAPAAPAAPPAPTAPAAAATPPAPADPQSTLPATGAVEAQSPSSTPVTDTPSASKGDSAALAAFLDLPEPSGADELSLAEPKFSLYGFADFSYFTQVGKKVITASPYSTFMVGNLNVYFSTEFEERWRSLAEVRFMFAPHGSWLTGNTFDTGNAERGDTTVLDGSDLNHPVRWGGIAIQRIWLEYNFNDYLTVRAGQWLTPYGIWNVDHGSPTIVGIYKPYIINQDWFPERQTGIEAYGSVYIADLQLGYHLTLSNGRGPIDAYKDLDNSKGVGTRLYVASDGLAGILTLGGSAYRGTYTDRPGNGIATVDGAFVVNDPPTLRYDEFALAADLKWEWRGLFVQSELIMTELRYTDAVRPRSVALPPTPPGFDADKRRWGMYGLLGYRTPWLNIMPFMMLQYVQLIGEAKEVSFGMNMRPSPRVALKAEYKYIFIQSPPGIELGNLDFLGLQLAWSF